MTLPPAPRQPALADVTCWPEGPSVSAALRPAVPALIEETIGAIGSEVPEYDRPLRGTFGENVRRGTTSSIERFLSLGASAAPARTARSPSSSDAASSARADRLRACSPPTESAPA